jgi:hypothetical protein
MLRFIERLETRVALCEAHDSPLLEAAVGPAHAFPAMPAVVVQAPTALPVSGEKQHGKRRSRAGGSAFVADNLTTPTLCAEEDNVNVPLSTPQARSRVSFTIEARHPRYEIVNEGRAPDFCNCPAATFSATEPQETFKIFDDHFATAVEAVRDPNFHKPGMSVRVGKTTVRDVHFIRLIRKIADADSWPEVLVLYADGNLRLKPQSPLGGVDPVFGSSVIVGPAPRADRPVAEIQSVAFNPLKQTLRITYTGGGSASLKILAANRYVTRVQVNAKYGASPDVPFATLRSMYVAGDNSDMDSVQWIGGAGAVAEQPVTGFTTAGGAEFLFGRANWSRHNTSAPDIWIGNVK